MSKLYFKFGAMGCSKTAQALITKFNYEEKNLKILLLKPSIDTRDGADIVRSRIGLEAKAVVVAPEDDIFALFAQQYFDRAAVIVDECQFLKEKQVDQLAQIVIEYDIPVFCFGLSTDFTTHLFEGSRRLFEIAESITEIKSVCKCGKKATVNARVDNKGNVVFDGEQVVLGGNDRYVPMCRKCWLKEKAKQQADAAKKCK